MIIMINGAFGAGKTTTAQMLQPLIPDSMIFDPEEVGCMLWKVVPEGMRLDDEQTDDFQDMELWRVLVVQTAKELIKKYGRHLIVPMTLYKSEIFNYILNGFRDIDAETYHFCLVASEETIAKRLVRRGDKEGGWSHQRIDRCVRAFKEENFKEQIQTDQIEPSEIVDFILKKVTNTDIVGSFPIVSFVCKACIFFVFYSD